jgi:hypothetical protein
MAGRRFTVERLEPRESLAEFVDYLWLVRWEVAAPHRQQVVPQPRVHLAAERGRLLVHGVTRRPFYRTLEGSGQVLGAAFHPGGFRPLLGRSVAGIVPAGDRPAVAGQALGGLRDAGPRTGPDRLAHGVDGQSGAHGVVDGRAVRPALGDRAQEVGRPDHLEVVVAHGDARAGLEGLEVPCPGPTNTVATLCPW